MNRNVWILLVVSALFVAMVFDNVAHLHVLIRIPILAGIIALSVYLIRRMARLLRRPMTAEMIACHAGCVDGTDPDAERDRTVPAALRRKVLAREGNACLACGCRHRLQAHHVVPFSEGGTTTLDNLITLCRRCHTAVHTGLLTIESDAKSGWRSAAFDEAENRLHVQKAVMSLVMG